MKKIVRFTASWCGPCKMIAPVFEKLSHELSALKFAKVNVDDNQDLAQEFGVMGIPCLIVFKKGESAPKARQRCMLS